MDESVVGLIWAFFRKQSSRYRKSSDVLARTVHCRMLRLDRVVPFTRLAPQGRLVSAGRLFRRRQVLLETVLLLRCMKQTFAKGSRAMLVQGGRLEIPQECVDDLLLGYSKLTVVSCWMSQVDFPFANDI